MNNDSTQSEVIDKRCTSAMQDCVNEFAWKLTTNGTQLKEFKCKEVRSQIFTPLLSTIKKST